MKRPLSQIKQDIFTELILMPAHSWGKFVHGKGYANLIGPHIPGVSLNMAPGGDTKCTVRLVFVI